MSSHGPHHRAFSVSHQRAVLDIQLDGRLRGLTEITIFPLSPELATVHLHSASCTILSISHPNDGPKSDPLEFVLNEPDPLRIPDPHSVRQYPEAKRRLFERVNEKETGELAIRIDRSKIRKIDRHSELSSADPAASTPAPANSGTKDDPKLDFEPIIISIEYQITTFNLAINHGLCVVGGDLPHVFTNSISARSWIPCVDSLWERCPWELELIVPKLGENGGEPVIVVASGELLEQIIHPSDPTKTVFHYSQAIPTSVQHIAWVAGVLSVTDLSLSRTTRQHYQLDRSGDVETTEEPVLPSCIDEEPSSSQIKIHAFCPPNRTAQLLNTVHFLPHASSFFTQEYGSYPYSSYKVAFVDMYSATHSLGAIFNSATLTLYPSDFLYPTEVIDQVYETKPALVQSLASQWVGINIIPKSPSDTWLINGLSLYITALYFKSIWGNNEYRFRIKKDMLKCVRMDVNKPPICQPGLPLAIDAEMLGFVNLKASLVLYILDRHLRRSGGGISLGLSRVIPKIFLSAISGEMRDNMLSTNSFLRICRKLNGNELKYWADQWIYSSGCPIFEVSANFNRKKMTHELNMKQLNSSKIYYDDDRTSWEEKCNLKPLDRFEGQMTIRIHESDGIPYEHVLDIKDSFRRYELPSNHRNKRSKRASRRYLSSPQYTGEGGEDKEERFTYKPWETSSEERDRWQVSDWTEEDDQLISQSHVEWIRLDVETEWICEFRFDMKEFMWLEQLQRDRDVVAQLEATEALKRLPSKIVSSYLCRTALITDYFFRIRAEAVLALVSCATSQFDFLGLFHLLKLFQSKHCFPPKEETRSPWRIRNIPRPNRFNDLAEYFIRKTLVVTISQVRDSNSSSPACCQQFFLDQLIYNDNSLNRLSDVHYLATLITAMADSTIHVSDSNEFEEAGEFFGDSSKADSVKTRNRGAIGKKLALMVNELERYLMVDRLVPSYRNLIALAVVEAKLKLTLAGLVQVDHMFFLACTRPGNYPPLRILAFDCLLLLRGFQEKAITRYMFLVMRDDQSLLVKRRLAMGLVQCLPVLVFMEDIGQELSKSGFSVIEGPSDHYKPKAKFDPKTINKHLRIEVGRALILRECIMSVMLHPAVDIDVQTCLLKISEVLFKPSDESVPVRLPGHKSHQAVEFQQPETPTIPKIRIPASSTLSDTHPERAPLPKIVLKDQQQSRGDNDFDDINARPSLPVSVEVPAKLVASLLKKSKPAPKPKKFQASGMSIPDHKMCQNLLKKLQSHPLGAPFRKAVDPIRQGAPNYFNIISRPMDFKTMGDKLENGQYPNREAFREDFNLVMDNCATYNLADSPLVVKHVGPMRVIFDKLWERSEKTMNALQAKGIGGSNAGWLNSSDTKPPLPAANNIPIAPPPSFAAFAAGGSMIPAASSIIAPPPPPTIPSPTSSRLSPEVHRPGGLKVKLKPRVSIAPTIPSPTVVSSPAIPPPSKPSLKIKLSSGPTSGAANLTITKTTSHLGPAFPAPPPPTFSTTLVPPESNIKPAPPAFPAPPAPTIASLSITPKAGSQPLASQPISPIVQVTDRSRHSSKPPTAQLHANESYPPPLSTPTPAILPHKRTPISVKSAKPPRQSSTTTPVSGHVSSLPNFPAPPPPSLPDLGLTPSSNTSSHASGSPILPTQAPQAVPSSIPTKINVIHRSTSVANQDVLAKSDSAPASAVFPLEKQTKATKNSKLSHKFVAKVPTLQAPIELSPSNSPDVPLNLVPEPLATPSVNKSKTKKQNNDALANVSPFARNPPANPLQTPDPSLSRATSCSSATVNTTVHVGSFNAPVSQALSSTTASKSCGSTDDILMSRRAKMILRKLIDSPLGIWFRAPVDPIAVGAPTYFDEIKNPMDLSTMMKKLDRGVYKSQTELIRDFNLIVSNCIQFNGAQSSVGLEAQELEKAWKSEWEKAAKLSYPEKRALLGLFNKFNQVPGVEVFNEPVDPVQLQIPQYFNIIGGQQNARDLGTIKSNLVADRYNNIQEFEADVRQMLKNCFTFNPPDTPVAAIGRDIEKVFETVIIKLRREAGLPVSVGNKRKGNEGGATSKRAKVL